MKFVGSSAKDEDHGRGPAANGCHPMMIRVAALLIGLAVPAHAADVSVAPGAVLRWLDKMTGETADIELSPGQSAISGRLTIRLDECRYPKDNPTAEAFAHLTVVTDGVAEPVFSGWMIASSPALSALEHPRYDVWVLSCLTEAPQVQVEETVDTGEDTPLPPDAAEAEDNDGG
jgi:hypothetical protein